MKNLTLSVLIVITVILISSTAYSYSLIDQVKMDRWYILDVVYGEVEYLLR